MKLSPINFQSNILLKNKKAANSVQSSQNNQSNQSSNTDLSARFTDAEIRAIHEAAFNKDPEAFRQMFLMRDRLQQKHSLPINLTDDDKMSRVDMIGKILKVDPELLCQMLDNENDPETLR